MLTYDIVKSEKYMMMSRIEIVKLFNSMKGNNFI